MDGEKKMSTMLKKKVKNLEFAVCEGAKERREMMLLLKEMKEESKEVIFRLDGSH